uniref:Uncharacterized protein n=1 Tax=Pectinophora gossypiella TaxID=13191 RepID=A0A1E1W385_PECGO
MIMYLETIVVFLAVVTRPCVGKPVAEDASVVSVYTTLPTTAGTGGLDVYQQIATNLAERFSDHIYGFLGIEKNNTENETTTKKAWGKIELLDDSETTPNMEENEIETRDTEELSVEALNNKHDKKPEKVTLFNSYLPVSSHYEVNETNKEINETNESEYETNNQSEVELDDPITLDDVDIDSVKSEGVVIFVLEFLGSLWQLAWGAITSIFSPSS